MICQKTAGSKNSLKATALEYCLLLNDVSPPGEKHVKLISRFISEPNLEVAD